VERRREGDPTGEESHRGRSNHSPSVSLSGGKKVLRKEKKEGKRRYHLGLITDQKFLEESPHRVSRKHLPGMLQEHAKLGALAADEKRGRKGELGGGNGSSRGEGEGACHLIKARETFLFGVDSG